MSIKLSGIFATQPVRGDGASSAESTSAAPSGGHVTPHQKAFKYFKRRLKELDLENFLTKQKEEEEEDE